MKTIEFIQKVVSLPFVTNISQNEDGISVEKNNRPLCWVAKSKRYLLTTRFIDFEFLTESQQDELLDVVLEYEKTPVVYRGLKTNRETVIEFIESHVKDGWSFESTRNNLEEAFHCFHDGKDHESLKQLEELRLIFDWYNKNSDEFIKIWYEMSVTI